MQNTYSLSKHVWNYEEFSVKYKCLDEQLKVGKYYVNTVLTLGNKCQVCLSFFYLCSNTTIYN
jgi:hypothetical protein